MYDLTPKSRLYVIFLQSYSQYSVVMAAILNFAYKKFPGVTKWLQVDLCLVDAVLPGSTIKCVKQLLYGLTLG